MNEYIVSKECPQHVSDPFANLGEGIAVIIIIVVIIIVVLRRANRMMDGV